jgi:hypothetical protein
VWEGIAFVCLCSDFLWDFAACELVDSFSKLAEVFVGWWFETFGVFRGGVSVLNSWEEELWLKMER